MVINRILLNNDLISQYDLQGMRSNGKLEPNYVTHRGLRYLCPHAGPRRPKPPNLDLYSKTITNQLNHNKSCTYPTP
jgi:hypothetical protein